MPRKADQPRPTPALTQWGAWWLVTGEEYEPTLHEWDPDTALFTQATLELLADGWTMFVKPGSGGMMFGIALWKGDTKYPPTWFRDQDAVDVWSSNVVNAAKARRTVKGDQAAAAD